MLCKANKNIIIIRGRRSLINIILPLFFPSSACACAVPPSFKVCRQTINITLFYAIFMLYTQTNHLTAALLFFDSWNLNPYLYNKFSILYYYLLLVITIWFVLSGYTIVRYEYLVYHPLYITLNYPFPCISLLNLLLAPLQVPLQF